MASGRGSLRKRRSDRRACISRQDELARSKTTTSRLFRDVHEGRDAMTSPHAIPPDDMTRQLTIADPDGAGLRHVSVAGGTYTILVSGAETAGRYCLIDMLVPDGGGPPPHRHDFEEMFTLLEGELDFTFRGQTQTVRAGSTVNIPANAPHAFKNISGKMARMLCLCAPAGQDELFPAIGFPVDSRTAPPPKVSPEAQAEKGKLLATLGPKYRTEFLAR
jgi:quercetin dioxygenase-like cupin family protein